MNREKTEPQNDNKINEDISTSNKKAKIILLTIFVLSLVVIVSTISYAYFTAMADSTPQDATLNTGTMSLKFADNDNGINAELKFGESITKKFTIENTGTLDAVAKIRWVDLINTYINGSLTYTLSCSETENGTYTEIVNKTNVPISKNPSSILLATNLAIPAGKTYYYELEITLNYLTDVDQTSDLDANLNTKFELVDISTSEPEPLLDTIFAKSNDVTVTDYEKGNKGEMYTFDHEAATQTASWNADERRDYRYIGANPNNWVRFNDEDWRIIGVFTVETSSGSKEQLIKIIRNESIGNMSWDDYTNGSSTNEWPTASLKTMLNGAYFNTANSFDYTYKNTTSSTKTVTIPKGLNSTAQNQVEEVKWYLGESKTYQNLGGPDYYNFERGETVYTGRSTNTIAKVGLMYPSDYVYTYANGVDNTCYTNGFNCQTSAGGKGWLYNNKSQWMLSSSAGSASSVFNARLSGYVDVSSVYLDYGVRPSVYLKSDIKIVSGNGTSSEDPYILG